MQVDPGRVIDVLIPVRAPAPWLAETLESICAQTISSWKVVLVMDGYSAEVERTCRAIVPQSQFELASIPAESGLVAVLNHGLALCTAEFIARLDADDLAMPERFGTQLSYMQEHPACVVLGTGVELIDELGVSLGHRGPRYRGPTTRTLRWRSSVAHPSVMMRRSAVQKVGGYRPQALHAEDYDLWLRMGQLGEVCAIPEYLTRYRIHDGQVTKSARFPKSTSRALKESRARLARAHGSSESAALLRHMVWQTVNSLKGRGPSS